MGSRTVVSGDLLIRSVREDELKRFLVVSELTFGDQLRDEDAERSRTVLRPERAHAAFDGGEIVGTAAAYDFTMTVPGGEVATAGVTMVGVLPTHRRRGLLTRLMRTQLDDVREQGEPIAALFASEAAIYGRFGYGLASRSSRIEAERARTVFRDPPDSSARVRLVPLEEAYDVVAPLYEEIRRARPGMLVRTEPWWRAYRLSDPDHWRDGGGPLFVAVLELDGRPAGYARYRIKGGWDAGGAKNELNVYDAFWTTPVAARELWRYLFCVDLVSQVNAYLLPPDHPLFWSVLEPRRLRATIADGLWVRVVDAEAALGARTYGNAEPVVIELADAFCPWNAGRWRISADGVERTDDNADLELGAEELGAVYLGGTSFTELAGAARVRELSAGALARADVLFRSPVAPWCPEIF